MRPSDSLSGTASELPAGLTTPRPNERRLLTAEQLADRWQVPKSHVYRLSREGAIPAVRLGRYYRYKLEAIEAFERLGHPSAETPEGRVA